MTTTDPKLIERMLEGWPYGNIATGVPEHYLRAVVLPIVAAAINEAVQNERAGVVATLRNLPKPIRDAMWEACEDYFISDQTTVDGMRLALGAVAAAIERGEHLPPPPAIEAKESQHG